MDALETQLRALLKAIDTVVAQRKNLAEAASDFSTSLHSLASVELSPALSGPLDGLAEVQLRIRELYERQAQQDVLTLGITMDEYIRLIGSVKTAFTQRQKSYHSWHAAESDLQKKKNTRDKLLRQGKSQQDRLNQAHAEVADAEKRVHQSRLLFEDLGRVMRNELERFEREKVEDFKSGVETFLESAVEAQKEVRIFITIYIYLHPFSDITLTWSFSSSNYGKHSSSSLMPMKIQLLLIVLLLLPLLKAMGQATSPQKATVHLETKTRPKIYWTTSISFSKSELGC